MIDLERIIKALDYAIEEAQDWKDEAGYPVERKSEELQYAIDVLEELKRDRNEPTAAPQS